MRPQVLLNRLKKHLFFKHVFDAVYQCSQMSTFSRKRRSLPPNYGFDAQNEVFVDDMIAAGIVDPTKVTRSALENAASVAEMVLTTESLVADLPEPPAAPAAGGDMGGMGGMY